MFRFPLWSPCKKEMFLSRAFYYMSLRVLSMGALPPGSPHGAPVKTETLPFQSLPWHVSQSPQYRFRCVWRHIWGVGEWILCHSIIWQGHTKTFSSYLTENMSRDSSVSIASRYGLDGPGSNPGDGEIFRTRPHQRWCPPNLLYNGYRFFPGGKAAGAWS
jgi:hypothetical protein